VSEQARNNFGYPTHDEVAFHATSCHQDHFMNSYDPFHTYMPLVLCDYCESSDHDAFHCPFRGYADATCGSVEKMINYMTDKMIDDMKKRITKYSQCLTQGRENYNELDSSLGSSKLGVSLYDDFELSYSARPNLNEEMPLPYLDQESDFLLSLSPALAPEFSSPTDVIEDVLIFANPPTTLNAYFEFEEGDEYGNPSELDLSITTDFEHHELDELDGTILQESCEGEATPTRLEFSDDILSIEYESFSCGFDVNVGLDVNLCAEYESFSFYPIRTDLLFGNCKSEFVKSGAIVTEHFDLDQTLMHSELKGLVDLGLTNLPILILYDNPISRPMSHQLASLNDIFLFDVWDRTFDRLKWALTCAFMVDVFILASTL